MTDRADPDDSGAIQITVLEKTYHMLCPDEERESLLAAAAALDEELQGIQRNLGVSKTETLAIMGALHITQELLRCQQAHGTGPAEPARPAEVASAPVSAPVSAVAPAPEPAAFPGRAALSRINTKLDQALSQYR